MIITIGITEISMRIAAVFIVSAGFSIETAVIPPILPYILSVVVPWRVDNPLIIKTLHSAYKKAC